MAGSEVKTPFTNNFFMSKMLGKTYVDPISWDKQLKSSINTTNNTLPTDDIPSTTVQNPQVLVVDPKTQRRCQNLQKHFRPPL